MTREFRPATIHMQTYTLGRRNLVLAAPLIGVSSSDYDLVDLADRKYEKAEHSDNPVTQLVARYLMNKPVSTEFADAALKSNDEPELIDRATLRVADFVDRGDLPKARAAFAALMHVHVPDGIATAKFGKLEELGEVVITANMEAESRQVLQAIAASTGIAHHIYHPALPARGRAVPRCDLARHRRPVPSRAKDGRSRSCGSLG